MKFRVSCPSGVIKDFSDAADAVRYAKRAVWLNPGLFNGLVDSLQAGKEVNWTYGFYTTFVTPIGGAA